MRGSNLILKVFFTVCFERLFATLDRTMGTGTAHMRLSCRSLWFRSSSPQAEVHA